MTALKAQPKKDLGQKTYMADDLKTKALLKVQCWRKIREKCCIKRRVNCSFSLVWCSQMLSRSFISNGNISYDVLTLLRPCCRTERSRTCGCLDPVSFERGRMTFELLGASAQELLEVFRGMRSFQFVDQRRESRLHRRTLLASETAKQLGLSEQSWW